MSRCRVFISYSHLDRDLVASLDRVLQDAQIDVMWDRQLLPGRRFNEQIRSYIEHAHVFLPVISARSSDSVWMNAEIGYALGLRIPVLPIGVGIVPTGMIQDVQAISLTADPADPVGFQAEVTTKLNHSLIEQLVEMSGDRPALFECTEDNHRRALLLAHYAKSVRSIGRHGLVRQKSSLTSFHFPTQPTTSQNWKTFFAGAPRDNRFLYDSLLDERRSLGEHARVEGCRLIIDSAEQYERVFGRYGPESAPARVRGLLEFLERRDAGRIEVAINTDQARKSSITLVGDWFSSEAISSKEIANLREAVFTRSTATVRRQIQEFDEEFNHLLKARNWEAENSCNEAVRYLKQHLNSLNAGSSRDTPL